MRRSSSTSSVKGGSAVTKKSKVSRNKSVSSGAKGASSTFITDVNQTDMEKKGPDSQLSHQEKTEGEGEAKESGEQQEVPPTITEIQEIEKKQKVVRPSTYRRIPSEELSKQTLTLPYGLKFKSKVGMPLPKNLEEAASSVNHLEEHNPQVLNDYALDLEVLLGNKRAPSPSPTKKEENEAMPAKLSTSAVTTASEGNSEDAAASTTNESEAEPEAVVAYDLERDGPPRFGGGNAGNPLVSSAKDDKVEDILEAKGGEKGGAERAEKRETVHDQLLGLPGALGITAGVTENYFGDQSRINFFDRYHYIKRQRQNSTADPSDRSAGLAFPASGEVFGVGVKTTDIPFAPVRPDGQGSGAALMSSTSRVGDLDITATGMLSDAHARGASRAGRGGLFSGHNAASSTAGTQASGIAASMSATATTPLGSTMGRGPNTTLLPPLPITPGLSAGIDSPGIGADTQQPSNPPVKINTGVEMSELFKQTDTNTRDLGGIVEGMRTLDQMAENARAIRENKLKAIMEERRLHNVAELTMEEEEAMEMEAIALQGLILRAAEKERRQNEADALAQDEEEEEEEEGVTSRRDSSSSSVATELTVAAPTNDSGALMTPLSPRSRYIDGCFRAGINPKASLMTRKAFSKRLDLRHHGIGDEMCLILTESIRQMPYLQSLIVQDNNLTDKSLGPLVQALVKMPNILEVDISNNIVGDLASNTLSDYLSSPKCPIIKLVMQSADVDDFECARFVLALQNNPSSKLQELDLTRNLLGAAEELNTVMPELVTAGEAFAELLEHENCGLTKLEIAWNMVRGESAETFADALQVNTTLTYLDLSYNAMGKSGGQRLGQALIENKTLEYLDISSNNLEATACFSVSVGLIENTHVRRLKIDGNPIGKLGAKALMQVPLMVGRRVKLSANNCNIAISDASLLQIFDFDNLLKTYELDCSQPFERAQAFMLLYTVACHHTYIFESVSLDGRTLELVPFLNPDRHEFFNEKQLQMERSLLGLIDAASDVKVAVKFFNSIDIDGSGELDRDEFKMLMDKMGIELDEDRLEEVFDTYDTDQGGTIGTDEFLVFLRRQKQDAEKRLFDLTLTPSFCEKADQAYNQQLHKDDVAARKKKLAKHSPKQRRKFKVPTHGKITIQVEDGFKRKQIFRTVTVADKESIEEVAEGTNDTVAMNSFGVMGVKMRLDEALSLYNVMTMESRNKAKVLSKILPQLANPSDARMLVQKVLKNDRTEMLNLRQTLGVAIRPLLGSMNGYYQLDLSVALDRLCLMRLLEQSTSRSVIMRRHKKAPLAGVRPLDLSQRKLGNSSFRNETYNGRPIHIDTDFATPLPRMGLLCFDFSGGNLHSIDDMICSDQRVVKILVTLHMMHSTPEAMDSAVRKLERLKKASERSMGGNGLTIYESSWERSIEVGEAMDAFYENLGDRANELEEVREQEDIPVNVLAPAHLEEIAGVSDEELTARLLGHHFDLNQDANMGPGSLDRKEQRARAKKAAALGAGAGDDASQTSLSLSHAGSQAADTMSLGTYEHDGSIATLSQEESQSVVLKATEITLGDDYDEDAEAMEAAEEDDEQLYVVITSIDTRGVAVGTSDFGSPDTPTASAAGEEQENGEQKEGDEASGDQREDDAEKVEPPRFPYVQLVLGDQRARSCSFARDAEAAKREAHLRDLQRQNHHHKHGRGHHGKKEKKKKAEGEAQSEEGGGEEEHDDVPVYPLFYRSPNFVCVKSDDAYDLETEALKKMVQRRRQELTDQWEKENKKREKEAKKKHGKQDKGRHQQQEERPKEDQSAAAQIHKPKKSIHEFGDEDSDDEGAAGTHEAGDTAEAEAEAEAEEEEEEEENLAQPVSDTPSEDPILLKFDPGPQGTTQLMLLLMDTQLLLPQEAPEGSSEAPEESEHEHKHAHEPVISPRELFDSSVRSSQVPTISGDPTTLGKVMVDLGPHMAPLMAGQEVDLPWRKLDIMVACSPEAGADGDGDADDESESEKRSEVSEGVQLSVKMMKGKELRQWRASLTERRQKRHEVLSYEALSDSEKERLRKEEEQMIQDSGLGGKKAEKIRLVGDDGEDDEDQPPRTDDQEDVHKDGRNINTQNTHAKEPWAVKFRATVLHDQVPKRAKALRLLEALDDSFNKLWLLCRHLALVLETFEHMGKLHRTAYFGSYRSDLVCQLYERLVDIRNFDLVLRVLHPHEVAAVKCRLGWLNFFNPLKPEGAFQLNLSRYEERMLAKFLCTLATTEPGNNWTQFQFRHRADKDLVPGWELTDGWVKQDGKDTGINPRGILTLFYYSGDGQRLQGCRPNINFRKALLNLCFLSETDFRPEEDFTEPLSSEDRKKYYEKGVKYAASNQGLFMNYLYCDKQTYAHVIPPKRGDNDDSDEESGEP